MAMSIGMMLFWTLIIVLGIFAAVKLSRYQGGFGSGEARRILEERFARGEIDGEEFRTRAEALRIR